MRFLKSLQQDAKLFLYIYTLLMVFRMAFLLIYAGQMGSASMGDVAEALWLGARISLKTTAFLVAFPFVFGDLGPLAGRSYSCDLGEYGCRLDDLALHHPHSLL